MKITSRSGLVSDVTISFAQGRDGGGASGDGSGDAAPVVVILPAFGTPARYYRHLTTALAGEGLSCAVVEYPDRDTPTGVGRHTRYGYDALTTEVHEAIMTTVRAEFPGSPVVLLGHSLGGQVALFATALHASPADVEAGYAPNGLILAATASPFWRGYGVKGGVRSFAGTAAMAATARVVGYWPGDRVKFWGRQSRVLVADWSRWARTGKPRFAGAQSDLGEALAAYDGEVLAISVPQDILAPLPAFERMLAMVPRASITRWRASRPLGHIEWVRDNADVVPVIVDWVRENVAG